MPDLENKIQSQIASGDGEAWRPKYQRAMKCRDLEDFVRLGMREFRKIRDQDDAWSRMVQAGKIPFDPEVARFFRERYAWWFKPCDAVLERIQEMEREFVVDGADEFRPARLLVKDILATPIDDVVSAMERVAKGEYDVL